MARHRQTTRQRGRLCHLTQVISHQSPGLHLAREPGELPLRHLCSIVWPDTTAVRVRRNSGPIAD